MSEKAYVSIDLDANTAYISSNDDLPRALAGAEVVGVVDDGSTPPFTNLTDGAHADESD